MAQQTSFLPGEDELKALREERDELRAKVKPLLALVKSNGQFLAKYAAFCHDIFFKHNQITAVAANTPIAMQLSKDLDDGMLELGKTLHRFSVVEEKIEALKVELNAATNGEYARQNPELYGVSPEQLEEQADEILEREGLDAETGEVSEEPDGEEATFDDGRNEDARTAI